ncbi:MAG: sigma-70 family RNA polymerase sigma factor [Planctomycetota bacterium]
MAWPSTHPSLIARLADPKDQEAWGRFDDLYGPLITSFCRSSGLQFNDAEDVRQIVASSLASAMKSFRYDPVKGRFRTYLGRSVRHAIWKLAKRPIAQQRGLGQHGVSSNSAEAKPDDAEFDHRWEQEWRRHHLKRAFKKLSSEVNPSTSQAFRRLLDGIPPAVVAEEMNLSVDAIYKIKQRCGARLRTIVDTQIREETRDTHR